MRYLSVLRILTILTVIALSLFSAAPAHAEVRAAVGTTLSIEHPQPVPVGGLSIIVIRLMDSSGKPVADQRIELFANGSRVRSARTDATGTVSIRVRRTEVGTYKLFATFKGSGAFMAATAGADLVVLPAPVEIRTTPPLAGLKFKLNNRVFSTNASGVALIKVDRAGRYDLEVLPVESQDSEIRLEFGRWGDDHFEPTRVIEVPLKKHLEVGFEVSYRVSKDFVDLSNRPVDNSRISSVTVKGSNGTTYTFEDHEPHWLPAGRVMRLNSGLQETQILYSVISVVIDGSNVVNQAQQRFYVKPEDLWTVQVLLYQARFSSRDALFGFPIGSGIRMEFPDGDVQMYSFDEDNELVVDNLARGIYRVTVTGANGYAPSTPIALSRSQDVGLLVFSYLDMGILLGIGLFLSIGLLLLGRPHLLGGRFARRGRAVSRRPIRQPGRVTQIDRR